MRIAYPMPQSISILVRVRSEHVHGTVLLMLRLISAPYIILLVSLFCIASYVSRADRTPRALPLGAFRWRACERLPHMP